MKMIKNERQYRITRAQAAKFESALKALAKRDKDRTTHPRLIKAQADAMRSQLESLDRELREYMELKKGNIAPPDLDYIAVVPRDLIRARIASGLSQKELAERLGMPEQQIQRYEAKEYDSVSLGRISKVARILQAARNKSTKQNANVRH
jgi:ribosome-binding protein aMBF1 (putative translation factor)